MARSFDVIVAGAGPAGSIAALKLARAGVKVCLLERGKYPGAKNMFGGLLHNTPVLHELFPDFAERAPLERHVYKKSLTILTPESAVSLAYETEAFAKPPRNGYTVLRPVFDRWLAGEAEKAGAFLLYECAADDFIRENGRIAGVTVKGREGGLQGKIVIAADGVLSFLAKKAGLRPEHAPANLGLGVKLLLGMPEEAINDRFGLVRDQAADIAFLGIGGIRGGGFLYTNREAISIGLVVHLDSLKASGQTPYDLLNEFLRHPHLKKLLKGAEMLEYSAHLIPEGGFHALPRLYGDGIMLAGDAAGLCYTNGINLEGINLAMTSGALAAETAIEALKSGDCSAKALSSYKKRLETSFVLKDMKMFKDAAVMMHNERLYNAYPRLLADILEKAYRAEGKPRVKLMKLARRAAVKRVGWKNLLADGRKIKKGLL